MAQSDDMFERLSGMRGDELLLHLACVQNHADHLDNLLKLVKQQILLLREPHPVEHTPMEVMSLSHKIWELHAQLDWWKAPPDSTAPDMAARCSGVVLQLAIGQAEGRLASLKDQRSNLQRILNKAPEITDEDYDEEDIKDLRECVIEAVMTLEYGPEAIAELFPRPTSKAVFDRFKRRFTG